MAKYAEGDKIVVVQEFHDDEKVKFPVGLSGRIVKISGLSVLRTYKLEFVNGNTVSLVGSGWFKKA